MGVEKPNNSEKLKLKSQFKYFSKEKDVSNDGVRPLKNDIKQSKAILDRLLKRQPSIYEGKKHSSLINYDDENALDYIKAAFLNNEFEILFLKSMRNAIKDLDFIDFIIERKVPFTSIIAKESTENLSEAFLYVSNKNSLYKGGNKNAAKNIIEPANEFSKKLGPIIDKLDSEGYHSLQLKADKLNTDNIKTLRGKKWSSMTVKRTWERWQELKLKEEDKKPSTTKTPKPE